LRFFSPEVPWFLPGPHFVSPPRFSLIVPCEGRPLGYKGVFLSLFLQGLRSRVPRLLPCCGNRSSVVLCGGLLPFCGKFEDSSLTTLSRLCDFSPFSLAVPSGDGSLKPPRTRDFPFSFLRLGRTSFFPTILVVVFLVETLTLWTTSLFFVFVRL